MVRWLSVALVVLSLGACGSDLSVDPALAESIEQIGQATTGQLEITREEWVSVAKRACAEGAHLNPATAERIAVDEGVVFIGTDRPVVETVQVIGEAVCAVNDET